MASRSTSRRAFRAEFTFQGGTSTGRRIDDNCAIRAVVPEIALSAGSTINPYCLQEPPFLTDLKALGSYTIPRIDVQVSGTYQSIPGDPLSANYQVPSATAALSLGRPLSGNVQFAQVNLVEPGEVIGDRINQSRPPRGQDSAVPQHAHPDLGGFAECAKRQPDRDV